MSGEHEGKRIKVERCRIGISATEMCAAREREIKREGERGREGGREIPASARRNFLFSILCYFCLL
jgi:hypothetical protein